MKINKAKKGSTGTSKGFTSTKHRRYKKDDGNNNKKKNPKKDEETDVDDVADSEDEDVSTDVATAAAAAAAVAERANASTTAIRTTASNTTTTTTTSEIVDQIAELCESILESPQQAFSVVSTNTNTIDDTNDRHQRKLSKQQQKQHRRNIDTSSASSNKEISKMDQLLHWARGGITTSTTVGTTSTTTSKNTVSYDPHYVSQLAIMSLLVIYKDILPSYRIRLPTTAEMAIKVSKDIQQLWDYERRLLNHYQQYLITLQNIWDTYNKTNHTATSSLSSTTRSTLAVTCILSMAELLKAAFHFNFRSNLLTAVIRQMNYRDGTTTASNTYNSSGSNHCDDSSSSSSTMTIRTACCDAIRFVFQNDRQGDVTLEATRQIAKYMKDRDYKHISIQMLQTLYYIPLRVHVDEAMAAKIATQVNKKKRKRNSEIAAIENEMKEGSTTVDKIVLAQCQSDTLQIVILTYFRILKSISPPSSSSSSSMVSKSSNAQPPKPSYNRAIQELLPTALEGLAKFAHLINIDTVIDLLSVLRDLLNANSITTTTSTTTMNTDDTNNCMLLPVDATLNCILTAFQTLQGPGKEMKIDMKEYIIPLYNQIPRLCLYSYSYDTGSEGNDSSIAFSPRHHRPSKSMTELLLQCLSLAFIQRREYSNVRIAAFMKQILSLTLHCASSTDMSIPLLAFVRQLVQRYSSALQQLYENEQDVITEGQYRMDVMDPEHANPYATAAWECTLLKFHYNTNVQIQANHVATCKMLNLPMECPNKLHETEQNKISDLYIPFVRQQKRHPLAVGAVQRGTSQTTSDGNNNILPDSDPKEDNPTTTKAKRTNVRFVTPRVKHCKVQIEPNMN